MGTVGLFILPVILLLSVALAVASCWGIYALTKQRWVWLLIPVFLVFWMVTGVLPVILVARMHVTTTAPANLPPTGMYEVVEEPEFREPPEEEEAAHELGDSP